MYRCARVCVCGRVRLWLHIWDHNPNGTGDTLTASMGSAPNNERCCRTALVLRFGGSDVISFNRFIAGRQPKAAPELRGATQKPTGAPLIAVTGAREVLLGSCATPPFIPNNGVSLLTACSPQCFSLAVSLLGCGWLSNQFATMIILLVNHLES